MMRRRGNAPPEGFEPAQPEADPITGHWPGWLPVGDGKEDQYHREAYNNANHLPDGTYELCGPKIQGNPEKFGAHLLIPHGDYILSNCPTKPTFESLKEYLTNNDIEGIVWWHPDGRKVKIKGKDFGIKR